MKQTLASATLLAVAAAEASSVCMYCRRMDKSAGFIVSYSYCNQTNECLKDEWNYLNRKCVGGWEKGGSLDLQVDCEPENITCPSFKSTPEKYQQYFNNTWTMAEGGFCTVGVDATEGIARVIFDNTS